VRKILTKILIGIFLLFLIPKTSFAISVPILMYHYIANNPNSKDTQRDALSVSPDKFEAQLDYLNKNGYTTISLDTLYGIFHGQVSAPVKPVILTIDDGYDNFFTIAYPILRKYNIHVVSFISTGLVGTGYYMNWNQIREIQSSGLVTFESHTITHPNLVSLGAKELERQLVESKNILQSQTGYPVNFIAYPYGASNKAIRAAAQKAGYVGGLGTWFGKATGPSLSMPRIRVSGAWSIKEFASRL